MTTAPIGTSSLDAASRAWLSAASIPLPPSPCPALCTHRLALGAFRRNPFERKRIPVLRPIHLDPIALGELSLEHRYRERVLHQPLNRALQGARTVDRIVALRDDDLLGRRRHLDRQLVVGEQLIGAEGYDPVYGARPLKRAIQRLM